MPMNNFNVLFWMSCIYPLQRITLVPEIHKMYEIDLKSISPAEYAFYMKKYFLFNDNIPIITEVRSPQSNIQGFVCIHSSGGTKKYIKNLYCFAKDFTNIDQIFHQLYFTKALGQQNILNIQIPQMLFNNSLKFQFCILVKKIGVMNLQTQNDFIEFLLLNKLDIILLSCQLLEELTNRPGSRIMHSLENEDYILAFFDRDYGKLIGFLNEFILLLQENDELLKRELPMYFTNFIKNNLNNFWKDELVLSNKDFNTFKEIHLFGCFFSDLANLFYLLVNSNNKFMLFNYDKCARYLFGCSMVTVLMHFQEDIDEKNLKCFVYDKKKNVLKYKIMVDSTKRIIFFMLDLRYLKESNIRQIDCIVQTPQNRYQSCDINLI